MNDEFWVEHGTRAIEGLAEGLTEALGTRPTKGQLYVAFLSLYNHLESSGPDELDLYIHDHLFSRKFIDKQVREEAEYDEDFCATQTEGH